jgi:putative addiction module component (TIGR02574 family)
MSSIVAELEAKIVGLDVRDRAVLAEKLFKSLENISATENEVLWIAEIRRRVAELESGEVEALDGEEVMQEIAAELR